MAIKTHWFRPQAESKRPDVQSWVQRASWSILNGFLLDAELVNENLSQRRSTQNKAQMPQILLYNLEKEIEIIDIETVKYKYYMKTTHFLNIFSEIN